MQTFESAASEYTRKIGYTTGAFELERFGWILQHEKTRWPKNRVVLRAQLRAQFPKVRDQYAQGILDFSQSLNLLRRSGETYAPTSKGLAYMALADDEKWPDHERPFFFRRVFEADSDDSLNILSLIERGCTDSSLVEGEYLGRAVDVVEWRRKLTLGVTESRRFDYRINLERASLLAHKSAGLVPPADLQRTGAAGELRPRRDTARHHVVPRIGWLQYLGLVQESPKLAVTEAGLRLLDWLGVRGFRDDLGRVLVPPPDFLLVESENGLQPKDLSDATAMVYAPNAQIVVSSSSDMLEHLVWIYERVKTPGFNQASLDSILEVLELYWVVRGKTINAAEEVVKTLDRFPEHFSTLRSSGRLGFLSLKKLPS